MLESEAYRKWCPQYHDADDFSDNRWTEDGAFTRQSFCLGPDCAVWIDTGYDDKAGERTGRCGLAR